MKKKAQRWRRGGACSGGWETIGPDGLRWQILNDYPGTHAEVCAGLPLPPKIGEGHPPADHAIVSWFAVNLREAKSQAMAFASRPDWKRLVRALRRERAALFKKTKKKPARVRRKKGTVAR